MKGILFSVLLLLLSACNSSDDNGNVFNEPEGPLAEHYYGVWALGDLYLIISKQSLTLFSISETDYCFEAEVAQILETTENSVQTYDPYEDLYEQLALEYDVDNDQLILKFESDAIALSRSQLDLFELGNACDRGLGVNSVRASLEVEYLPSQFLINRIAMETGRVEIEYRIEFDINENGLNDPGDIMIKMIHYKGRGDYPSNYLIRSSEIGAQIWHYTQRDASENFAFSSIDSWQIPIGQSEATLNFEFQVNRHPLLALVTDNTPVQVFAYLHYPSPTFDELTSEQDGPWNWSSDIHEDRLPDSGYYIPNQHNQLSDGQGDLIKGESLWVDIKSLTLTFTK
ncbi:hypothetical protein [Thalassotalea sp. PS06]|uniref:hypothetical protein n=1 Tax=Thalassotalea sp. PS06 TaxID=2594005 RepID=UPI001163AAB7|nr:hypothetical protein [Thalassotalea sp. PS06]QDP02528.1 hypothetical protein FNC98_14910 [Thalassotalea sp. PS06]